MALNHKIIPAILPFDFEELEDKIDSISGLVTTVQVDICAGRFTETATWPYRKHDDNFEEITREERGMPHWQDISFEFDLMLDKPEEVIDDWILAGAERIIVHHNAQPNYDKVIELTQGRAELGIAVIPGTDPQVLAPYFDSIQSVQCMGSRFVGRQGTELSEDVYATISKFRKALPPHVRISVDIGVNLSNASKLFEAGADTLVAGSAIFGSQNIVDTLQKFKKL